LKFEFTPLPLKGCGAEHLPCFGNCFIIQIHTALHAGHGLHEAGPVLFRQALVATEAGEHAHMADVGGCVVLLGRGPAVDDVPDARQPVLGGIGAQQAEGGTQTVLHGLECAERGPSP